jgi:hypothetical protein
LSAPPDLAASPSTSLIIVTSNCAGEPWRLAQVQGGMTASGRLKVHYYNRRKGSNSRDVRGWWPAYTDVRDGADVLTHVPGPYLQPHCHTISLARVILTDVQLTETRVIRPNTLRRSWSLNVTAGLQRHGH